MSGRSFVLTICVLFAANLGEIRTNMLTEPGTPSMALDIREELTDDYRSLISNILDLHFKDSKMIFVEIASSCVSCEQIIALLMRKCKFLFFTANDAKTGEISLTDSYEDGVSDTAYHKFVIFLVNDVQEFGDQFDEIRRRIKWNPRARHLIVFSEEPPREQIKMVFKTCWKYKMLNVGITIVNRAETYTYNPFLSDDFYEEVTYSRLFYDKLQNTNGYVIPTRYIASVGKSIALWLPEEKRYKHFGTDFGFATVFFQAINATPLYRNFSDELMPSYENFTYRSNIWKDLVFQNIELWFNVMATSSIFRQRTEISYPLGREDISVIVPKSELKTPSIFQPYDNITWTCIFFTLLIFSFYTYVFYQRRGIDDNAFIRTWGIFLGKGLSKRDLELLEKFVFLLLTTAALLILSAYQGSLYGALTAVKHGPDINTLEELFQVTKHIHAYVNTAAYMKDNLPEGVRVHSFESRDFVHRMKISRHVYIFPKYYADFTVERRELYANGHPMYHVMREYIMPVFVNFFLPYGSPYLDKLDVVCSSVLESGLKQFWDSEADLQALLSGKIVRYDTSKKMPEKISLEVQMVSFYILAAGLLISTLCFAAELYIARRNPLPSGSGELVSR